MSASLVLITGPYLASPDGEELLRIVTGMAACGDDIALCEIGAGIGAMASEDLSDEAERYVEGLASLGIEARPITGGDLHAAIAAADRVLVLGSPSRPRRPALLVLDDAYLRQVTSAALLDAITNAGGVIRG